MTKKSTSPYRVHINRGSAEGKLIAEVYRTAKDYGAPIRVSELLVLMGIDRKADHLNYVNARAAINTLATCVPPVFSRQVTSVMNDQLLSILRPLPEFVETWPGAHGARYAKPKRVASNDKAPASASADAPALLAAAPTPVQFGPEDYSLASFVRWAEGLAPPRRHHQDLRISGVDRMKVSLVSHTPEAAELLLFTKSTRLTLTANLLDEIRAWPEERKREELAYMARTIPSSWEFVDYVFSIEGVSRAYTHQQVRTRAGSYAQQTMRVLEMGDFDYVFTERNLSDPTTVEWIERHNAATRETYAALLARGQAPEDARGILPTNIATNIVCKFNLRTLSELARSRTGGRTQDEYRRVINAMIDAVLLVHPWAGEFLFPRGRNIFTEIEALADTLSPERRAALLKAVDALRKELS